MNITTTRTNSILNGLQSKHGAEWCGSYGEPGYTDPEKGIIFCNWNGVDSLTQTYLKEAGFELEWSDEWMVDYNHDKAYRTQPDSYSWVSRIHCTIHGEIITPDDDIDEWIADIEYTDKLGEASTLPNWISEADLTSLGWTKYNEEDYQNGFHHGQTDDPSEIGERLLGD